MALPGNEFLATLRQTQWMSEQELASYRRPMLDRLLRHAALQTAFYPERLAPLFNGGDPSANAIDFSRWHEVPILRRADAPDQVPRMKARQVPQDAGFAKVGKSSGSTGRPFQHWRSAAAIISANQILERVYEAHAIDLGGRMALITSDKEKVCQYPGGARFRGWNSTLPMAELCVLAIETASPEILEWLERIRPDHVMTYPVTLADVAALAEARRSPLRFATFVSGGEILTREHRDLIASTFGCRVIDVYGAREVGTIAFECPSGAGYHLAAETLLCEIVDDAGLPMPAAEAGRVVVTSLYNYAMPLIRYDIGDYAVRSAQPCPCGRGLPLIDHIAGRTRNMIVMPDGTKKRYNPAVLASLGEHLSYREIQFVQTALDTIEIRFVPQQQGATAIPDTDELTRLARLAFHPGVSIQLVPVDRISRGPGMKIEQFVSNVTA